MPWAVSCSPKVYISRPKRKAMRRASAADAGRTSPLKRSLDGFFKPSVEKLCGKSPTDVAGDVGRLFFPQSQALGIAPDDTASPRVLRKMVYAGSHASSFEQASADLKEEAEVEISAQRVMRATKRIGMERVARRDAGVAEWEKLSLPEQGNSPCEQVPQVACVEPDGGRIQIRDRNGRSPWRKREEKGRFWRETKVGCLLSMRSERRAVDPCPTIPETFVDPQRIGQISREIKGFSAAGEAAASDESSKSPVAKKRLGQPEVLVRSVVATREKVEAFGKQLAAAAHRRGFMAAERKAFVGDGAETNWSVWRRHFSHFTPIVDFIHALCYVFSGAMAGRTMSEAWPEYCQWAQWLWSGQVELVIAALRGRQKTLGLPDVNDAEESPRSKVAETLCYLENWDGAGFHTSKRLCTPENVTLLQLPAYSPELNPIENLWHYLKSHYWSNRAHANYEALEVAAIEAWHHAVLDTELMKTVCAAPYLKRAISE